MKRTPSARHLIEIGCLASLLLTSSGAAQIPFAGEDFDNGEVFISEGLFLDPPISSSITPDLSATTGRFPSSMFDIFGVVNRNTQTPPLPFDLVDESLEGTLDANGNPTEPFLQDSRGILRSTDTDNVFAISDTMNHDNPSGETSASWTFNIAGKTDLTLSINFAAQGDFEEATDSFGFVYSIDGGPTSSAFLFEVDESKSIQLQRESTELVVPDLFFSESLHEELALDGEFSFDEDFDATTGVDGKETLVTYAPGDDGVTNGDTIADDGLVLVELNGVLTEIKSYEIIRNANTPFASSAVRQEFENFEPRIVNDPLTLNGAPIQNVLTEFTSELEGVGSTLTLTLRANTNSSLEYFVFDEIVLSGVDVIPEPLSATILLLTMVGCIAARR